VDISDSKKNTEQGAILYDKSSTEFFTADTGIGAAQKRGMPFYKKYYLHLQFILGLI